MQIEIRIDIPRQHDKVKKRTSPNKKTKNIRGEKLRWIFYAYRVNFIKFRAFR